jgi:rubrerythrin
MSPFRIQIAFMLSLHVGSAACAERATSPPPPSPPTSAAASAARGDGPGWRRGDWPGRRFDPATVETIRGRAVRVDRVAETPDAWGGVHVTLSTRAGDTVSVHLGPAWFLDDEEIRIQPGDTLEVTGSRVISEAVPALIAQRLVTAAGTLVLRDDAGVPVWSARRGRGAPMASTAPAPAAAAREPSGLTDAERRALREALDDEQRAWATYDQVIRDFGPVRPFAAIRDAEARHIEALAALSRRHGVEPPESSWPGRVPRYASVRDACAAAVEAEIANAGLYRRLEASTTRPDLLVVFTTLRRASEEHHLRAFRRCAGRGGPRGMGRG